MKDVISREDRLVDLANTIENDDSGYWTKKKISSALKNISSISGKWIALDEGYGPYICSLCEWVEAGKSKYCPNCGHRMGG
jgi:rubrerythrin